MNAPSPLGDLPSSREEAMADTSPARYAAPGPRLGLDG